MVQVVAAVIERDGKILAGRRTAAQTHPLKWEFPGGKVEPGETPDNALARELEEELGIRGAAGEVIDRYPHRYPGRDTVELIFMRVTRFDGEPRNRIFHTLEWHTPADLAGLDFIGGDLAFLKRYRGAPEPVCQTGGMPTIHMVDPAENEFLASLEAKSKKPNPLFRAMANRPEVLKAFVPLYGAIMGPGSVERRVKLLVYLACSYANECAFCLAANLPGARKAGVSEDEIQALQTEQDHVFSGPERAAILYARELTQSADGKETRPALLEHFSAEQVVEITLAAAMANFTNRFNNGLGILPDGGA